MKLIVTGATGYVGSEIIRQSLSLPGVTSVVAVSRSPVTVPPGIDSARFKSVVLKDYGTYPADVKEDFAGAAACIWTVGITPMTYKSISFDEARRSCIEFTLAGFQAMHGSNPSRPFRFIYMSGADAERDQTKTPERLPEYFLMRGETENQVFKYAEQHPGQLEAYVARPGWIVSDSTDLSALEARSGLDHEIPIIRVESIAAALLQQALHGFERETLWTDDLKRLVEEKET